MEVARQDACGRLKLVDYTCLYWGMFFSGERLQDQAELDRFLPRIRSDHND